MSRPLRIEYPGAYYHVMNRGLTDQPVFVSDSDFRNFLGLIEDAWRRWGIRVFSYCLMDNHYHLVIQTPEASLQRVMRHIDGVYTQRFNRNHQREGPLFRGRYKAILIDADAYLAAVVRYVHLNPVEAGRAQDPEDYPWSSHRHYLRPGRAPRWISLEEVLSRYPRGLNFQEFVLSGNEEALLRFYSSKKRPPVLGDDRFMTRIKEGEHRLSREHVGHEARVVRPEIASVIRCVAEAYQISEDEVFRRRRGQRNEARQVAMYLMRELCDQRLQQIAEVFSLRSYGGVGAACSIIEEQIKTARRLRGRIEQIREAVKGLTAQKKT